MQFGFELHEALGFRLLETGQWHARHLGDDFRDDLVVDGADRLAHALFPLDLQPLALATVLVHLVADLRGALVVSVLDRLVLLDGEAFDLLFDLREIRWLGHRAQTKARACFVDHIDRLVGLHAAWDVAA